MDALIYTAMTGADRALHAQQVHANSLANLDTPGFRANVERSSARQVEGYGYAARHLNQLSSDTVSGRDAPQHETGRELDVALKGPGLFAVGHAQSPGAEAYTRAGNFSVDAEGRLMLGQYPVLGAAGTEITLPSNYTQVDISDQGVISVKQGDGQALQQIDQLKLVNAPFNALVKNEQGLLVSRHGNALDADPAVRVNAGRLEGSNVSAVEEMVATMSLARDFEMQMKLFKAADTMADSGNRLIRD
jgi:flagellar basal-body rod protein FlgF